VTAVVFLGPTLPVDDARKLLDGLYLGPVAQGDVYRATRARPGAIAIIDGFFHQVPAVWHKEILWALKCGIRVFGGSSMGALRAAELEPFGMVGVGRVFEAFRSGALEDDDEVALAHASAAEDYAPLSEAMVNVRATLAAAEHDGVVGASSRSALERIMKGLAYPSRTYETMTALAVECGAVPSEEIARFRAWLQEGRVDQKAADAVAMLEHVRHVLEAGEPPPPTEFEFPYTAVFDELRRTAGALDLKGDRPDSALFSDAVLDEARLAPEWERLYWGGLARALALREAQRNRLEVDDDMLFEAIVDFRRRRGLLDVADFDRWLAENQLTRGEFLRDMEVEAQVRLVRGMLDAAASEEILLSLRLDGSYAGLVERVRRKRALFDAVDANPPDPETYERAIASHFGHDMGCDSGELERLAVDRGFASADALLRSVVVEYLHSRPGAEVEDGAGSR
jgi:hypothetical protein